RQKLIKSTKGLAVEALLVTGTLRPLCGIVVVVIVSLGATRPRTTPGTKRRPQQRHRVAPRCLALAIRRPMLMFTRGGGVQVSEADKIDSGWRRRLAIPTSAGQHVVAGKTIGILAEPTQNGGDVGGRLAPGQHSHDLRRHSANPPDQLGCGRDRYD